MELRGGEGLWNIFNKKLLNLCHGHFNESLEWNAIQMSAIYDRYEGYSDLGDRWRYLKDTFIPLEAKGILHDDRPQFRFYFMLLREVSILMARYKKSTKSGRYAMKAYDLAKALKDRQFQCPDKEVDSDAFINEWILCAWQLYRLSSGIEIMSRHDLNVFVRNVLEEMKAHVGKFFCFKRYSVVYAQLTAEYAMETCLSDSQEAMNMIDGLLDLLIVGDIPDDVLNLPVSQKAVSFMTRTASFMGLRKDVDYSDISFAWALVARSFIRNMAKEKVESAYAEIGDETETVMKLPVEEPSNIWDRQLDPRFVLLADIYVKLLEEGKRGYPNMGLALHLSKVYMGLFEELDTKYCILCYRFLNYTQHEHVRQILGKLSEDTNNRKEFSQKELEHLIDEGLYDKIIQSLCFVEKANFEEIYYLGLAYLRSKQFENAINVYRWLLGIRNLPAACLFSCMVNYLFALLVAGRRDEFYHFYKQLDIEDKEDSDVVELYKAYRDSLNRHDGMIALPEPYGYKL